MNKGLFVGSFDPFTIGHDSIVRRALPLFDHIIIGVGVNERKKCMLSAEERVKRIKRLYADEPKIEVKAYSDLTIDFARREQATYIIKGVRSMKDFEYEREQADVIVTRNKKDFRVEDIDIFTPKELIERWEIIDE